MKKISLMLLVFGFVYSNAQNQDYVVKDLAGNTYENNSVHIFDEFGYGDDGITPKAKIELVVHNQGSSIITVIGEIVEMTNANPTDNAAFCFGGECYYNVVEGGRYPTSGVMIAPGTSQGNRDYFGNLDGHTSPIEYKFRFLQLDANGVEIPNTSFYLTYRYESVMSVLDANTIAIAQVYPTVAKGFTNVTLKENASVQVLNMEGKAVKSLNLKSGNSQLDLSGLSAGVYLIQFKGDSGLTTIKKVVVK